jgi:hypothetical protein
VLGAAMDCYAVGTSSATVCKVAAARLLQLTRRSRIYGLNKSTYDLSFQGGHEKMILRRNGTSQALGPSSQVGPCLLL